MDIYIIIVFICLLISLLVIFTKGKFNDRFLNITFKVCLFIGILKYIALLIFHSALSPKYLYNLRFLPLISLITLFILGCLVIYFILEKKLNTLNLAILIVILLLGTYIIYNIPFGINNSEAGYVLVKNTKWMFIESFYSVLICVGFIAISLKNFFKCEILKNKICFIIVSISFIGVLVEEIMAIMNKMIFHFKIIGDLFVLTMILVIIIVNSNFNKKEKA